MLGERSFLRRQRQPDFFVLFLVCKKQEEVKTILFLELGDISLIDFSISVPFNQNSAVYNISLFSDV